MKNKKITLYKLRKIFKYNEDVIKIREIELFGQDRFMIYFKIDCVIYSETFNEIKKFNNEFFIMANNEQLILVIYN